MNNLSGRLFIINKNDIKRRPFFYFNFNENNPYKNIKNNLFYEGVYLIVEDYNDILIILNNKGELCMCRKNDINLNLI